MSVCVCANTGAPHNITIVLYTPRLKGTVQRVCASVGVGVGGGCGCGVWVLVWVYETGGWVYCMNSCASFYYLLCVDCMETL